MTRAFVAIRPPESVLDAIAARLARVELADARFAPREQWHITVQFLGNDADIDGVATALAGLTTPRGTVLLNHAASLGNPKRDRLLVLTLREGNQWMLGLAHEVADRLRPLGHEPDAREFRPHLTLARGRKPLRIRPAITAFGSEPVGEPWVADQVILYESRLSGGPAQHVARFAIPLV